MYEKIQMSESLNYLPGGLAYDRRLRNKVEWFDALTFDWVHTFLQDGVMNVGRQAQGIFAWSLGVSKGMGKQRAESMAHF